MPTPPGGWPDSDPCNEDFCGPLYCDFPCGVEIPCLPKIRLPHTINVQLRLFSGLDPCYNFIKTTLTWDAGLSRWYNPSVPTHPDPPCAGYAPHEMYMYCDGGGNLSFAVNNVPNGLSVAPLFSVREKPFLLWFQYLTLFSSTFPSLYRAFVYTACCPHPLITP